MNICTQVLMCTEHLSRSKIQEQPLDPKIDTHSVSSAIATWQAVSFYILTSNEKAILPASSPALRIFSFLTVVTGDSNSSGFCLPFPPAVTVLYIFSPALFSSVQHTWYTDCSYVLLFFLKKGALSFNH